ncbi:MAG: serine/threonine protein kinase, partial [Bacteroidales bacterium]|nr:serine/threonine protein kinase [Bacteroidales bacterium]
MVDNQDNTLGSGFVTDGGGNNAGLGSGFVTDSSNAAQQQQSSNSVTFTDLKELSSQGAMSTVYQGKKYGKWHIIKRIKPQFKDNPQYRELFLKEFDNGVQLDHPNIVRLEDKGEDADGLWYSMEYVDGRPLSQMIQSGELKGNPRLVRNILEQLCDALTYVHKKQIVHRDLKPDNILVTYRGDNVKVLDFGLAYSDSYDDHLVKAGTPKYAAPEQMTRGNTVDQRADIYAVGLMLLEMTTGSLDDRQAATVADPNFQAIIQKATQQNPADRYHDCREIVNDL